MIIVSGFLYNFEKKITLSLQRGGGGGGAKLTKDLLFDYSQLSPYYFIHFLLDVIKLKLFI